MESGSSSDHNPNRPKISTCLITYNDERFIGKSLESVLMQEVDFPIEVVVGEDCSTDRTREIVTTFVEKRPDAIRLSEYEHNIGAAENFKTTIKACRGQYIAMLHGDDYWTSRDKLRKQVEFLDSHPDFSMCFHPVKRVYEDSDQPSDFSYPPGRKRVYRFEDLARWIRIQTSSIVFRNGLFGEFPEWFNRAPCGDWPLFMLNAEHGDVGYLDEVMGVHRIHREGMWYQKHTDRVAALESNIRMEEMFIDHYGPERHKPFVRAMYRSYYDLAHHYAEKGDSEQARFYARKCIRECKYNPKVSLVEPVKIS